MDRLISGARNGKAGFFIDSSFFDHLDILGSLKVQYCGEAGRTLSRVKAVISASDMDTIFVIFQDNTNPLTIDGIPAGPDRKIELFLYDADSLIYHGLRDTDIIKDGISVVDVALKLIGTGSLRGSLS